MSIHLSESAVTAGIVTVLEDAESVVWDASPGLAYSLTPGGNRTIENPTNLLTGGLYILVLTQDDVGSRVPVWGSAFRFPDGIAPDFSTAANSTDVLFFFYDGTYMNLTSSTINVAVPVVAPSDLTASDDEVDQVTLNWVNNATDATSVVVERFELGNWSVVTTLAPTIATYVDVITSGSYDYRVVAVRGATRSSPSNTATGVSVAPDISPPINLTATTDETGQISLLWEIIDPASTSTRVERDDGLGFEFVASVPAGVAPNAYVDTIAPGTYPYRVITYVGADFSAPSNTATGVSN